MNPGIEERIDALWNDRDVITLIEFYDRIGYDARNLIRAVVPQGWSLKPMDAIHLATAQRFDVDEFHTYDKGLPKYSQILPFDVLETQTRQLMLLDTDQ